MKSLPVPSVGVVIVNHNAEAYVAQAIRSVASQSMKNFSAIVVDDASTDRSPDVIRETLATLGDTRFRPLLLTENVGQTGAARRGMSELSDPFVCFLDSDDLWYDHFLERHLSVHLNTDFPVGVTYSDCHFIDRAGQMLAGTAWWFGRGDYVAEPRPVAADAIAEIDCLAGTVQCLINGRLTLHEEWSPIWSSNSTSGMMFRRALVDLVLSIPDDELRLYMDAYLSTFSVLLCGAIAIDDALYAYRMHGSNQHSNSAVLGGTAPTSRKAWGPIYRRVLGLIHRELSGKPEAFEGLIDPERYAKALRQVTERLQDLDGPPPRPESGFKVFWRRLTGAG